MVDDVRRVKTGDYVDKSFLDIQHFAESVEERIHVLACRGPIQRHAAVTVIHGGECVRDDAGHTPPMAEPLLKLGDGIAGYDGDHRGLRRVETSRH